MQCIATITLVVPDYDEAITYFVQNLDFQLLEDTPLTPGKTLGAGYTERK